MARADKLVGMKMPGKPMAEEELDMDLEGEALEEEEMLEGDEAGMELEEGGMAEVADEELIMEAIARGLLPEDFEMPGAEVEEDMDLEEDLPLDEEEEEY